MKMFDAGFHRCVRASTAAAALAAGLVLPGPALADGFVPNETLASSNKRVLDPEFNMGKGLFTWVDILDGSIWLSRIDKATGAFIPETAKDVLIEKSAAPPGGLGFTLNGPEWVLGADGDAIVYTRFLPGVPATPANAQIGAAIQNKKGAWVLRTLSQGRPLNAPYGSDLAADPKPRITYNDAAGNHFWRELNDPNTEVPIPATPQGLLPAIRHVRGAGAPSIVYPVPVNGTPQVHRFTLGTNVLEQVTFEAGAKDQPWMWPAPDFGNSMVMLTTVDGTTLALYQNQAGTGGSQQWTQVRTIQAPLGGRFFSTEPFVYGGKSYVVFMVIVGDYPTSIWLADFDAQNPLLRRLTPEAPDRARADPEIFFTDAGPIVFFSRFNQTKGSYWLCVPCAEGLYRADTGIAPQ
jgi:hypothetical protein